MNDRTRLVLASGCALGFVLAGCDSENSYENNTPANNSHDNHDHDGENHDHDHDHGDENHEDEPRSLGSVTIGETTLDVAVAGDAHAGEELHVDIERTAGPTPAVVRVWIGSESGEGSLKAKADVSGDHFHAHAQAPDNIDESALLWIEAETADGQRAAISLPLR